MINITIQLYILLHAYIYILSEAKFPLQVPPRLHGFASILNVAHNYDNIAVSAACYTFLLCFKCI